MITKYDVNNVYHILRRLEQTRKEAIRPDEIEKLDREIEALRNCEKFLKASLPLVEVIQSFNK